MAENQKNFFKAVPIELTPRQHQIIEILGRAKSPKYALSNWYLGAIYAAKNTYNPDRYAQAAQSIRELLEKLPRVFIETEIQGGNSGLSDMRRHLYTRLCADKNRFGGTWKGKEIDTGLDKTICKMDSYLKRAQKPTRKEQICSVMSTLDPMYNIFDQGIQSEKSQRFKELWGVFEDIAHHQNGMTDASFWEHLSHAECLIIDLLAPITSRDQHSIKRILGKPIPDPADVEKLIELIKRRGANYAFFFQNVDSPVWITPLVLNGFFKNPPNVECTEDGRIVTPFWRPIFFLQKISAQSPEQVVEIVLGLEKTDNPRILREIFSIACDLADLTLSLRLKPLIKKFLQSSYRWGEDELIVSILKKWGGIPGSPSNAAHEILQFVVAFQPDPEETEKREGRKENPTAGNTSLEPIPHFDQWEYQQILEKGVRPLSEREPYQVARILIDATASMVRMGMHPEIFAKGRDEDYSEIWCRRLDKPDRDYQDAKEVLVQTLTYACEQVYANAPESIEALDQVLRNQRWKVFMRLRQQLYASHPNEQTLPWIRELILEHENYPNQKHHYEFQLMIRKACEYFGSQLLSEEERRGILDVIFSGPSKEDFCERTDDRYSDEDFRQYQRYFHRMQLRPFYALLSGEHRRYFEELEGDGDAQAKGVTDDSYSPYGGVSGGTVSYRSPKSVEDLGSLTNEELLTYLNDWDDEHRDKDKWLVEINIAALAGVFQSLCKEKFLKDGEDLTFWMANRDRIARPVYVVAMIKAMLELVKEENFDNLDQWIGFCAWVLSHPDPTRVQGEPEPSDESCEYPDWGTSRRAVVDFIDACLDVNISIATKDGLAKLLEMLCTQFDWRLDHDHPILLSQDDSITEAINNTRSRALESLIKFGFWVRQNLAEDAVSEVTDILSKRLREDAEYSLTKPEYALLGMHFGDLCVLNEDWAVENKKLLFPVDNIPVWREAFGNLLKFTRPAKLTYDILKEDFQCALDHLDELDGQKDSSRGVVDRLAQHLFTYYLWVVYPLTGTTSLLAQFYEKTTDDRQRWVHLFNHVGHTLSNSDKNLNKKLVERVIAFFDWRFKTGDPLELQKFTFWLSAECLDAEWRLTAYSNILDLGQTKTSGLLTELDTLKKLLPNHLPQVIGCFAKITDVVTQAENLYVRAESAKPILKAGLSSDDSKIRENAERARENLLKIGRFDFLDFE